tara:strand:- start:234 stop:530 length:297 start_codon:yes stop_codon:yes gene_type:complete
MVNNQDGILLRSEIDGSAAGSDGQIFAEYGSSGFDSDFEGDFEPYEHFGIWITGYTETTVTATSTAQEPFNVDVDEDNPPSADTSLNKYKTYDDYGEF